MELVEQAWGGDITVVESAQEAAEHLRVAAQERNSLYRSVGRDSLCNRGRDPLYSSRARESLRRGGAEPHRNPSLLVEEGSAAVVFVCLDLPPAPQAGIRIADFARAVGLPVVLVTRSMRWLPPGSELMSLPWVTPEPTLV